MTHVLFMSHPSQAPMLTHVAERNGVKCSVVPTDTELASSILALSKTENDIYLIAYESGIVLSDDIHEKFGGRMFNVHASTPEYPGYAPHNFAAFDAVSEYGATAHVLTAEITDSDILFISTEPIPGTLKPNELMAVAQKHSEVCLNHLLDHIKKAKPFAIQNVSWAAHKKTQIDFESFCRISTLDTPSDTKRHIEAINTDDENNAYLDLNGHRFTYEGPTPVTAVHKRDEKLWSQFTEDEYRKLLIETKENYKFATYTSGREGKHVLWRHDMDHSIHQAYELAKIDHEVGVVATYMFTLRLPNYNILEYDTQCIAREILKLGHKAGLHFDVAAYEKEDWTYEELEEIMAQERALLEQTLDAPVEAMSYHDPDCGDLTRFNKDIMAGMVNCYSKTLQDNYEYCSDSNGYWRHRPIPDVIRSGEFDRIHVLTHPEWWTREAMPPRQRIEYSQLWHAQGIMKIYDKHLGDAGRLNIR